jgi:hypothetical protein
LVTAIVLPSVVVQVLVFVHDAFVAVNVPTTFFTLFVL